MAYQRDYQGMGATFLRARYNDINNVKTLFPNVKLINIDMSYYYSIPWNHAKDIFESNNKLCDKSLGIHWFAGWPLATEWQEKLNEDTYKNYDNMICNILKEIL